MDVEVFGSADRRAIASFAQRLQTFVTNSLLLHRDELGPNTFEDMQTLWRYQEPRFARLYEVLGSSPESAGQEWSTEEWADLDRRLEEVGLSGREGAIKFALFEEAANAHDQEPSPTKLGTALSAADITLGSLVKVFAFVDPVKEAKESIEFLFGWGRGWLRKRLWGFRL